MGRYLLCYAHVHINLSSLVGIPILPQGSIVQCTRLASYVRQLDDAFFESRMLKSLHHDLCMQLYRRQG